MDITKASFWSKQHRNDLFTDRQNTSYNLTSSPASPPRPIFNNLLALRCCLCNSLQTPRVNPSRVVWGPSHALCRGLVWGGRGWRSIQAGRPPVFRACAVGTLNPPRGAGGENYETLHWCSWCSFSPASSQPHPTGGHWPHVPTGRVYLTTITSQKRDFQTVTAHCTVGLVVNNHHYSSTVFN